ncbi:MAG: ATP-dependent protease subunit HslV [Candidatus Schekmanbacteria bacterium]|nr:MAG: ATP-dependent protease subunit HslV [Candidatus Schekmanbacteria bacterium]
MVRSTTILCVRRNGKVAMAGDGQVTFSNSMIMKRNAKKVRRLYKDKILAGFSGSSADAITLLTKFEEKLDEYSGNLSRAAVELARDWRRDKILTKLEALIIVSDKNNTFVISGTGDVIEPDDDIIAIGSGGPYAQAAAKALMLKTNMSAVEIVREAMEIAASICVFTNNEITVEVL